MLTRFAFNPAFNRSFFREVDELFSEQKNHVVPAADIRDNEKNVELRLDMPGVTPEKIDVKLEGNRLTITAERNDEKAAEEKGWVRRERSTGTFMRSFTLDETLDGTQPEAAYKHGVLTVTIPKKEATQPRSLKVKVEA
ncbi:MAG: Hsp20/alpha crystallin family protein [Archangium sp.]